MKNEIYSQLAHSSLLPDDMAAAILAGIRASTTEVVCSIDCDCTYDPRQLLEMIPMMTDGVAAQDLSGFSVASAGDVNGDVEDAGNRAARRNRQRYILQRGAAG